MHKAIKEIIDYTKNNLILVDGRDFKILTYLDNIENIIKEVSQVCIEGGIINIPLLLLSF